MVPRGIGSPGALDLTQSVTPTLLSKAAKQVQQPTQSPPYAFSVELVGQTNVIVAVAVDSVPCP